MSKISRTTVLALIVLATIPVGTRPSAAAPRSLTQVSAVAHGLRLTLAVQRTTYPLNAIVPATVTLENLTNRQVRASSGFGLAPTVERVPSQCHAQAPRLWGIPLATSNGCSILQAFDIFPGGARGTYPPGLIERLRPHGRITVRMLFVLRSAHIRATDFTGRAMLRPSIATPPLGFRLTPAHPPRIRFSIDRHERVVVSAKRVRGMRLLAAAVFECLDEGNAQLSGAIASFLGWHVTKGASVRFGSRLPCGAHFHLVLAVGRLNQSAAIIEYDRR